MKIITTIFQTILSVFIMSLFVVTIVKATVTTSGNFPTALNNFQDGDVINSGDWGNIETVIGISSSSDNSTIHGRLNTLGSTTTLSQLASVGTITTGVWNATEIQDAYLTNDFNLLSVFGGTLNVGNATATTTITSSSGRLGIASTTPFGLLSVNGGNIDAPQFVVGSSTGVNFIVSDNGNVGVGATTSPGTLFSIQGIANFTVGSTTYQSIGGIDLQDGCFAIDGVCLSSLVTALDDIGDVTITSAAFGDLVAWNGSAWVDNATSTLNVALSDTTGTLAVARGGTGLTTFGGTNTILYTTSADTLASNANFVFNGTNVGIGTSSPYSLLSISGGTVASGTITMVSYTSSESNASSTFVGPIQLLSTSSALEDFIFQTHNPSDGTNSAGDILINPYTKGGVGGIGQVFIGMQDDDADRATLEVGGTLRVQGLTGVNTTAGGDAVEISYNDADNYGQINAYNGPGIGQRELRLGNDHLYLTTTSRVGVSTSTPAYLLDVDGDLRVGIQGDSSAFLLYANTTTNRVGIGSSTPWGLLSVDAPGGKPALVVGSSTTQFIVDENGNVGIGTTTPAYLTDVNGALRVGIQGDATAFLLFVDTANNKVGIGSSTPSKLLSVGGSAEIQTDLIVNGALYATEKKGFSVASTTLDYTDSSFSTATSTWYLNNPDGVAILDTFYCKTDSGALLARIGDGTNWSDEMFCGTNGFEYTSIANNVFTDREDYILQTGSATSTVPDEVRTTHTIRSTP